MQPAQRRDLALVVEQPVQLGGHQRGEERDVAVVRQPVQGVREGALDHDGLVARDQGPADHLHARDVRRRQRQQPLAAGPQPPGGRVHRGEDRVPGELDPLGRPGRARGLHHQRRRLGHHRQPVAQRGDHLGGPATRPGARNSRDAR